MTPTSSARSRRQRGVALVEFAIVAPLLFLLIFGIVEFGWAYTQYLDVRHGARETARLAAVNYQLGGATGTTQSDQIIAEGCARMDTADNASVTIALPGTSAVGERIQVDVSADLDTLTGFLDSFLSGVTLESNIDIRVEDTATWLNRTATCP